MDIDHKIFVIMPFSKTTEKHTEEYWTNHYSHLLTPTIQEITKMPVERSKAIRTDILTDIIKNLVFSQIVIADITDLNANVMWELGVRQSFSKGTIVIAENGTVVPFDLSIKSVIQYPKLSEDPSYHKDLKIFTHDFKLAIRDCISHPEVNDSHVLETISGRGTIYDIIFREDIKRKLDALIHEFSSNINYLNQCLERVESNKLRQKNTGHEWAINRLRANSLELLTTTRYLPEDVEFYRRIEICFDFVLMCNSIFNMWSDNRSAAEKWLDTNADMVENSFKESLDEIQTIRDAMEKVP